MANDASALFVLALAGHFTCCCCFCCTGDYAAYAAATGPPISQWIDITEKGLGKTHFDRKSIADIMTIVYCECPEVHEADY